MRYRIFLIALLCSLGTSAVLAQSAEYSRKLAGSLEISPTGRVRTYDLQSAGAPSIDQGLGSLVESWQFNLPAAFSGPKAVKAEFVVTVLRGSISDKAYSVKRIEIFPVGVRPQIRGAVTPDEMAYCRQADAAPRNDIICPAVLPNDSALEQSAVSAEVFVAIRKTAAGPEVAIESLYLYTSQNAKLLNKVVSGATAKYSEAALAWAKKNSSAFLQDNDAFMTRVEYVQSANNAVWRRQEKAKITPTAWVDEAFLAKTRYVSQGGLTVK